MIESSQDGSGSGSDTVSDTSPSVSGTGSSPYEQPSKLDFFNYR